MSSKCKIFNWNKSVFFCISLCLSGSQQGLFPRAHKNIAPWWKIKCIWKPFFSLSSIFRILFSPTLRHKAFCGSTKVYVWICCSTHHQSFDYTHTFKVYENSKSTEIYTQIITYRESGGAGERIGKCGTKGLLN